MGFWNWFGGTMDEGDEEPTESATEDETADVDGPADADREVGPDVVEMEHRIGELEEELSVLCQAGVLGLRVPQDGALGGEEVGPGQGAGPVGRRPGGQDEAAVGAGSPDAPLVALHGQPGPEGLDQGSGGGRCRVIGPDGQAQVDFGAGGDAHVGADQEVGGGREGNAVAVQRRRRRHRPHAPRRSRFRCRILSYR